MDTFSETMSSLVHVLPRRHLGGGGTQPSDPTDVRSMTRGHLPLVYTRAPAATHPCSTGEDTCSVRGNAL